MPEAYADVLAPDGVLFHKGKNKPYELDGPRVPLADTHGHLTCLRRRDAAVALARAALAGVRLLVVPIDPTDGVEDVGAFRAWLAETLGRARELLADLAAHGVMPPAFEGAPDLIENVHVVAGVHPYGAERLLEDRAVWARLEALLDLPEAVGVGEIGLDCGPWSQVPVEAQERAFRAQMALARERALPVELHIRDAADDVGAACHALAARIVDEEGTGAGPIDLHCFTSGPDVLAPFVERGCHIAFGGAMTFGRSADIRESACACPQRLLLSETDSPYMAPHPLRGQEAEPAMVAVTVARLAEVREEALGVEGDVTRRALWENACSFFALA